MIQENGAKVADMRDSALPQLETTAATYVSRQRDMEAEIAVALDEEKV